MLSYYLLKWNLVLRPPEPYGMVKWIERKNFLLSCVDPTISSLALLFPTLFQMNMVLDWVIGPCSQLSSSFHICKRGGMCTSQPPWVSDLEGLLTCQVNTVWQHPAPSWVAQCRADVTVSGGGQCPRSLHPFRWPPSNNTPTWETQR